MPNLEEILPIVLVLVIFFILFRLLDFIKPTSQKEKLRDLLKRKPLEKVDTTPDTPVPFGYKISWLAIKCDDIEKVVAVMNLKELQPANWSTGIDAAYNHYVFISPAVKGWTLVVSNNLPELNEDRSGGQWTELMSRLTKQFPDVQYFSNHRVSDYYSWAKYENGQEIRSYAYTGSDGVTLADRGAQTPEEIELDHHFFNERDPEAEEDSYWEREDLRYPDEEDVMQIAGMWSLNPQELANISQEKGCGYVGVLKGT